jgi:hypothetical protein
MASTCCALAEKLPMWGGLVLEKDPQDYYIYWAGASECFFGL